MVQPEGEALCLGTILALCRSHSLTLTHFPSHSAECGAEGLWSKQGLICLA